MHDIDLTLSLADEAATLALGAALANVVQTGDVIWLCGDLGAGKTTLVRGLLRAAGETGKVKSPTYTLIEVHQISGIYFYHFDFYRFNQPEDFLDAGLEDYFDQSGENAGVCLVEWPDKAQPYLGKPDLQIDLRILDDARQADLVAASARGAACLAGVRCWVSPPPA